MGEATFIKNQYGKETVRGTAVPATRIFPGTVKLPADRKPVPAKFMDGTRFPANKMSINQILADGIQMSMPVGVFQGLPMLFATTLKGGVTATEQTGGQGDYLWTFTPSWTASNAQDAITLETGDDTQAYEVEYVMGRSLKFAGKVGDESFVSVDWTGFGKQITATTFTAGQSLPGQELIVGNLVKIYMDAAWAGIGATEKTGILKEWTVEIQTGTHPKILGNGTKLMSTHGEGIISAIATFTFEGNSETDSIWDQFQAGSERAIRIAMLGSAIGTGQVHSCKLDLFGTWSEVIPLNGNDNGNNLHTAIFEVHSDRLATPHALAATVSTSINTI